MKRDADMFGHGEGMALRRMRGHRWDVPQDPVIVRLERFLAPLGRFLRSIMP
jgi:hypothetical protein